MGKQWKQCQSLFFWAPKSLQMVTVAMKLKDAYSLEEVMTNLDSILKSRDITWPTKVRLVKGMVFPVVMYGCESWTPPPLRGPTFTETSSFYLESHFVAFCWWNLHGNLGLDSRGRTSLVSQHLTRVWLIPVSPLLLYKGDQCTERERNSPEVTQQIKAGLGPFL